MERLFNLDFQLLHDAIFLAIAVFVLFFLISYLLFDPARKMLQQRKEKIATEIATAAEDKEAAAALKAEYEEKLKNIDKEAETILSNARQNALMNAARIEDEARSDANRIVRRAEEEAVLEKQRVMDEMKSEIINIASLMAGKVVAANIDTTVQDSLIDETLKEMGEETWQS
ncbi:MAG: F0F1 ATP synthase subunit B [Lachnospiraceae bacterium]|nr:F0F1 ATP synthase subunit B [Lachnospiraceae bacterium]